VNHGVHSWGPLSLASDVIGGLLAPESEG